MAAEHQKSTKLEVKKEKDARMTFSEAQKKIEEREKLRMVYSIFASMLVCGTLYLNISSFYPIFVADKYGDKINTLMIACALCCFNFAGVVCSPIHAVTISKMGRKNAMLVGFVCILVSNTALGMLSYIPASQWKLFFILSCVARFFQGYGDSLSMATAMSLISTNFPEEKEKFISYIGASMGFGLMLGPPLGSFIFGKLSFAMVFYFFSIWIFVMMILQYVFIPSSYNKDREGTILNHQGKKKDAIEKLDVPASRSASFATATASLMSQKEAMKSVRNIDQMRAISVSAQTKTKEDILQGYNNIEID